MAVVEVVCKTKKGLTFVSPFVIIIMSLKPSRKVKPMTDFRHRTNARKLNLTPEQYSDLRMKARIRLDRRMKKVSK